MPNPISSLLLTAFSLLTFTLGAQPTESGAASLSWLEGGAAEPFTATPPLPYPSVREVDLMWSKRVWRVIDTREKMNLPFRSPDRSLYEIVEEGIASGAITPYSPEDDRFQQPLDGREALDRFNQIDTVRIIDPVTGRESIQVVRNLLDPSRIVRWRIQEVWYFDSRYGSMKARVIGLAPLLERRSETHELTYETPMFWINYAQARAWLAQFPIPEWHTDRAVLSWEDLFEMRRFHGTIIQESEVQGRRLQDYLSGEDLLQEAARIDQEIQAFEMNVWEE